MNYAYLGKRLKSSAAENFPVFLADLVARADQAYLTPSTRAFCMEHGDPADYEFPSSQAILEYATHRLLWSWYRRDGEPLPTLAGTERTMDDNDVGPMGSRRKYDLGARTTLLVELHEGSSRLESTRSSARRKHHSCKDYRYAIRGTSNGCHAR